MDKPTTPGESNSSKSPGPEEPASEQGFGATGIFRAVKPEQPAPTQAAGSRRGRAPIGIAPRDGQAPAGAASQNSPGAGCP